MGRRKNQEFWVQQFDTASTYKSHLNMLTELALNMFEYENLPETMNERYLEYILLTMGRCLVFEDEILGIINQKFTGRLFDWYGNPSEFEAFTESTANGTPSRVWFRDNKNAVPIYNNRQRCGVLPMLTHYAGRMTETLRAIDTNIKQQKTPYIITVPEQEQKLTLQNIVSMIEYNAEAIFVDKSIDMAGLGVHLTPAPYVADNLRQYYNELWVDAMTYIGIDNNHLQKTERVLESEFNASLAGVEANRITRLVSRQEGIEAVNKMFGTNIGVKFRYTAKGGENNVILDNNMERIGER